MVAVDQPNQLRLLRASRVVVLSVEDMIHSLEEAHTRVRTSSTTTPAKVTNLVLVMI